MELEDAGYNVRTSGQKTYNGVAILSRRPLDVEITALPGDGEDTQARYIEALIDDVRVASLYLPNGNPTRDENGGDSAKFLYKLGWMQRLVDHAARLLDTEDAFVLGGDYNICPTDEDVHDPARFADDALCRPESRQKFRALMHLGLTDADRVFNPEPHRYSYWDYKAGAWQKDNGLKIDCLLLSPQATDRLLAAGIDRTPRGQERPSDHTPVWCELSA
jgi:exodeoxyribonuclease-3